MGYLVSGLKRKLAAVTAVGVLGASAAVFADLDRTAIKPDKNIPPVNTLEEEKLETVHAAQQMGDAEVTVNAVQTTAEAETPKETEPVQTTVKKTETEPELTEAPETTVTEEEEDYYEEPSGIIEVTFDPPADNSYADDDTEDDWIDMSAEEQTNDYEDADYADVVTTTTVPADDYVDWEQTEDTTTAAPVITTTTTAPPVTTLPDILTVPPETTTTTTTKATAAPKPATTTTTTTKATTTKKQTTTADNGATPESRLNNAVLSPNYCLSGDDDKIVRTYLAKIVNDGMSNYEKALAVYDYLIKNTYYAYGGWNEPYKSVLVNGFGTCTEYSRTLTAMLKYMGFNARTVDGQTAMAAGGYGYHMWTEVIINGQVYVMDAQVDDDMSWGGYTSHARFCKTYAEVAGNYIKN